QFHFIFSERDWFPDFDALAKFSTLDIKKRQREFECRRHNSDDGECAPIQHHFAPEHGRIGIETAYPDSLADNYHVVVAESLLVGRKGAPMRWLNPEQGKQTWRNNCALNSFRIAAGQVKGCIIKCRDLLEAMQLRFVIAKLGGRDR